MCQINMLYTLLSHSIICQSSHQKSCGSSIYTGPGWGSSAGFVTHVAAVTCSSRGAGWPTVSSPAHLVVRLGPSLTCPLFVTRSSLGLCTQWQHTGLGPRPLEAESFRSHHSHCLLLVRVSHRPAPLKGWRN